MRNETPGDPNLPEKNTEIDALSGQSKSKHNKDSMRRYRGDSRRPGDDKELFDQTIKIAGQPDLVDKHQIAGAQQILGNARDQLTAQQWKEIDETQFDEEGNIIEPDKE